MPVLGGISSPHHLVRVRLDDRLVDVDRIVHQSRLLRLVGRQEIGGAVNVTGVQKGVSFIASGTRQKRRRIDCQGELLLSIVSGDYN